MSDNETFTYTLTAQQRQTLRDALGDAFAYANNDSDESWPMDAENRARYQELATSVFGFGDIDN